jgi:hypothetical protein
MSIRKEFAALVASNKDAFKQEMFSLIEDRIAIRMSEMYLNECENLFNNIIVEKSKPQVQIQEQVSKTYMPIAEFNNAINNNTTNWITAKDGSQLEITPKMAKYLAELYNSLNSSHKDKLINLILESDHGFKKAVKTAERIYGAKNGHK